MRRLKAAYGSHAACLPPLSVNGYHEIIIAIISESQLLTATVSSNSTDPNTVRLEVEDCILVVMLCQ